MRHATFVLLLGFLVAWQSPATAQSRVVFSGQERENNLVTKLLEVAEILQPGGSFAFTRVHAGYIFATADCRGKGTLTLKLDDVPQPLALVEDDADASRHIEAVRNVSPGDHKLKLECARGIRVEKLVVKAIPELTHCGLGFDPAIKSYGKYDLEFLKKDILPNVTTLIVRANARPDPSFIEDWHRQGKKFVAEVGISQAKTADEHFRYWTGFLDRAPFLDGIIIDEFIVNTPYREWVGRLTPERKKRFDEESTRYPVYEAAFRKIRADRRYRDKMVYVYIGGSGKKLNQEIIGPNFVHSILDCDFRVAPERYIFEVSSEQKSKRALQQFVDGIADWVAKEPTVREKMVLTFGLFSMPPGGINKQPNVDFHVWMDQQMNVVANDPVMAGMAGLNWWTSLQADEETVRFVGKLYRHYAIEGKKDLLTKDPLFLTHLQNTDFEKRLEGWTLHAAEEGSIQAKRFPRYGRIEGRYMGLGRPADPEHIGDTFLWMKRSAKGANTFSQPIKDLQPGCLYSLKMFTCDYRDLIHSRKKTMNQANPFMGTISLEGVEVDKQRSFNELYASSPEPPIPVWITYHWFVFRAKSPTARITVSDWDPVHPTKTFGQEQTFNFLELEPYRE
ncbi:MAG TPA: hypothetical protein VGP63_19235 [Planctomycetaceae bacterium]|nr:hypothetical protein [Planctomycetaceae bacterium]